MKSTIPTALTAAMLALTSSASAQQPWTVELRGGGALPTVDVVDDSGTGNGVALEGALSYRFVPYLDAYVAWDWVRFAPETSFAGPDVDFEGTGYLAGLRFEHPVTEAVPFDAWVRAGVRYDHLELEDADGDIIAGTGRDVGFDLGAGVSVQVAEGWSVTPGVRYRAVSHDVQLSPRRTEEADLRHVVVDVGVSYRFDF
jgi:opacity protein-like surface antigen